MKMKNGILKTVSVFALVLFILSIGCLDSNVNACYIALGCLLWLVPFGIANGIIGGF